MEVTIMWNVLTWGHALTFVMSYWLGGVQFPTFRGTILQKAWTPALLEELETVLHGSWLLNTPQVWTAVWRHPEESLPYPENTLDHAALSVFITSMAFIIKTPGHLADKIAYLSQNLINSQHERSLLYTVGNLMHHQEKWVRCTNYYS